MRLILMGTGPFAVPTFDALVRSEHDVLSVVTRPVPEAVGRRKDSATPVQDLAVGWGLPVLAPENANEPRFCEQIGLLRPELLVVCDFGQLLSREMLATATLGGINLHGSLLPRYRGAAPINWALRNGDEETGVTVIHMTPRLDAGPTLTSGTVRIQPEEDAVALERRLAQLGIQPVMEAIDMLAKWDGQSPLGQIQDPALASRAPRLKKMDGQVDWSLSAGRIHNQVRAFKPWPGTFSQWLRAKGPMRLILDQVSVVEPAAASDRLTAGPTPQPGDVVACQGDDLWVMTGDGVLAIHQIQPAGKRAMGVREFLRGYPMQVGDRWGE